MSEYEVLFTNSMFVHANSENDAIAYALDRDLLQGAELKAFKVRD